MLSTIFNNKKLLIGGIVGMVGIPTCYDTIPPNHVGYSNLFGNVSNEKLLSGIHLKNPFVDFIKIPLLTSNLSVETDIATKEGLILSVQTNAIYKIDEDKSRDIYLKYRTNYESIFIKPLHPFTKKWDTKFPIFLIINVIVPIKGLIALLDSPSARK